MAIRAGIEVAHDAVFPHGAYVTGPVEPVHAFNDGKRSEMQKVDENTGLRVWAVPVLDGDPELKGANKATKVTILAEVQPVPPEALAGVPMELRPVEFEGLTAVAYCAEVMKGRFKVAWSIKARGMKAPGKAAHKAQQQQAA